MAGEGGVEQDYGTPENEVPLKVQTNGDLTHERQLGKESTMADGIGVGPSITAVKMNGDTIRAAEVSTPPESLPAESPPPGTVSGGAASPTPGTVTKGKGLKKWRRIKRDLSKDGGAISDTGRIHKRGLSITEPPKANDEGKQKGHYEGESSVASADSKNLLSASNSPVAVKALDTELELLAAVGSFSVGIDSETSDDRSSRFSTAASTPRSKHEGLGHGKDKNRVKNFGGKGSSHAVHPRGQRGKGNVVDPTKKLREDQLVFEKENSHSSIESDLRSSATVIAQWGSTTSNGRQSEGSLNYDGENRDPTQGSEEVQTDFHKENGGDVEDSSRNASHTDIPVKDKIEESENYPPRQEEDPFAESMILLQEAQEALEKELQNFSEIGLERTTLSGNSSVQFSYEETEGSSSVPLELKVVMLSQKVEHLERELEEASSTAKANELRVMELEAILEGSKPPKDTGDTDVPREMVKEVESELESLFRKKIETEVEYLTLSNALQKTLGKPFNIIGQQEYLAEDYEKVKVKLNVAEDKAILLKRKMEELDVSCQELVGTEEVLKLQNGVCRFSLCCFIQVMLLLIAFALFLMQLLPPLAEVVPT